MNIMIWKTFIQSNFILSAAILIEHWTNPNYLSGPRAPSLSFLIESTTELSAKPIEIDYWYTGMEIGTKV